MQIVEALLLTVLVFTCGYVSYTDYRYGIIENRILATAGITSCVLNIVYYAVFAGAFAKVFLIDLVLLVVLSVCMYALNLWAAGDSKLLFLVVSAIPGRLYDTGSGVAPAIYIIVFTFSISFVYVILESVAMGIRRKEKPNLPTVKEIGSFIKNYVCIIVYILAVNCFIALIFPIFVSENPSLIAMLDLFLSIIIHKYPIFFKLPIVCLVTAVSAGIIGFSVKYGFTMPNLLVYGCIAIILLLRTMAERYNYAIIPTADVKAGMILSFPTVLAMAPSRVAGLPRTTTEDMRSRLTSEEASAVVRWGTSKSGSDTVSIVRKIPFAIFIMLGALTFIVFRLGVF